MRRDKDADEGNENAGPGSLRPGLSRGRERENMKVVRSH